MAPTGEPLFIRTGLRVRPVEAPAPPPSDLDEAWDDGPYGVDDHMPDEAPVPPETSTAILLLL